MLHPSHLFLHFFFLHFGFFSAFLPFYMTWNQTCKKSDGYSLLVNGTYRKRSTTIFWMKIQSEKNEILYNTNFEFLSNFYDKNNSDTNFVYLRQATTFQDFRQFGFGFTFIHFFFFFFFPLRFHQPKTSIYKK